jgi:hypothetical protein
MLVAEIPPSLSLTRFTILPSRPLTAIVEDDNPRSDEFCASTDDPAALDFFDNDREGKSIVQGRGNPMMLLGDVTEVNSAMVI